MFAALYRTCAAVIGYSLMISSLEDLRDGFYHLPLAEYTRLDFGVNYNGSTYVFSRLPMGLSISPSEMQDFACVTVKLVEKFPGVRGIAYMDDFLFVARHPSELNSV